MDDREFDVIVVGSGATGCWSSFRLAKQGLSVLLLEQGPFDDSEVQSNTLSNDGDHFKRTQHPGLGGRMTQWGRIALRMTQNDFLRNAIDGQGTPWPLDDGALAPNYNRIERAFGITGRHGQPAIPLTEVEYFWKKRIEKNSSKRLFPPPEAVRSIFDILKLAQETTNLTLKTKATVTTLTFNTEDYSTLRGVEYYDRTTNSYHQAMARDVVLAASTIDSTRLLFNSSNSYFPHGVGGGNGGLGSFLMDHTCAPFILAAGYIPDNSIKPVPQNFPRYNFYIPNFVDDESTQNNFNFTRGYALWGIAGRPIPHEIPADLASTAERIRSENLAAFWFQVWGEPVPSEQNRLLPSNTKDSLGLPLLKVNYTHSENDIHMRTHQIETIKEITALAGFRLITTDSSLAIPGSAIHEVGTARIGHSEQHSVLNTSCRVWETKNLYVVDGAAMPSLGSQNPTLTMMALADRAADDIIRKRSRRETA